MVSIVNILSGAMPLMVDVRQTGGGPLLVSVRRARAAHPRRSARPSSTEGDTMSTFAPTLQAFFTDRLVRQRQVSPHTLAAYRDTFRLLLGYAKLVTGKEPAALDLADLDAALISDFLDHLEHERGNCVRTRNARLAALRSFYRFASYRHPEHAASIQQ